MKTKKKYVALVVIATILGGIFGFNPSILIDAVSSETAPVVLTETNP